MHIMIDIETLGTTPGSVIVSVGAVAFNPTFPIFDTFHKVVDIEDAQRCGLSIDAGTVKWWLQQPSEARQALTQGETCTLHTTLVCLSQFIRKNREILETGFIWAKPTTFDIVLLEAAYQKLYMPMPWHYRDVRDVRTFCEAAKVWDVDIPFSGVEHNALDDAIHQAKYVIEAYKAL